MKPRFVINPHQIAHKLEEVSEEYAEDIHRFATMLNSIGRRTTRTEKPKGRSQHAEGQENDEDSEMALHLYDVTLL